MKQIPKDIIEEVNKITNELLIYKNEKKLSWIRAYKDVLEKLNMQDKKEDIKLLTNTVTQITRLGYDIQDNPFNLTRYK